jgi:hypothetical protein
MARRVVISLTRAINDPQCELERPSDWISRDPDFSCLRCSSGEFKKFLDTQKHKDYPAVIPEPAPHRYLLHRDSTRRLPSPSPCNVLIGIPVTE